MQQCTRCKQFKPLECFLKEKKYGEKVALQACAECLEKNRQSRAASTATRKQQQAPTPPTTVRVVVPSPTIVQSVPVVQQQNLTTQQMPKPASASTASTPPSTLPAAPTIATQIQPMESMMFTFDTHRAMAQSHTATRTLFPKPVKAAQPSNQPRTESSLHCCQISDQIYSVSVHPSNKHCRCFVECAASATICDSPRCFQFAHVQGFTCHHIAATSNANPHAPIAKSDPTDFSSSSTMERFRKLSVPSDDAISQIRTQNDAAATQGVPLVVQVTARMFAVWNNTSEHYCRLHWVRVVLRGDKWRCDCGNLRRCTHILSVVWFLCAKDHAGKPISHLSSLQKSQCNSISKFVFV